jgi:hypothetical protein
MCSHEEAVFIYQIVTRLYVKTTLALASRVNVPRMKDKYEGEVRWQLVLYPV